MFQQLIREILHAARTLFRAPGFTVVTTVTLALAIGANAAIFSVVDGVLLEPLPFEASDRLVVFRSSAPGIDVPDEFSISPEFMLQYREAEAIEDLGLLSSFGGTLRVEGVAERLPMALVTGSLFTTLGAEPTLGRLATEEELQAQPDDRPAVLSHATWASRFGSDPGVVGSTADIAGSQRTIIGVMGPDFTVLNDETALWIPFELDPDTTQPGQFGWNLIGRIKPGVEIPDVLEQITPLTERLKEVYASAPRYVAFLEQGQYRPIVRSFKEQLVGNLQQPLWILLGTVGFVLLIACANVANLFLVRSESRERDMAVRAALGSGRARLIRSQLAEAIVLGALGGVVGIALAAVGIPLLLQAAPDGIPRIEEVGLDATVLTFTVGLVIIAALIFGTAPALRYSSPTLLTSLRYAGRGAASGRNRHFARSALVVAQSSLALVLLVGSGLLVRSFWELRNTDPGFDSSDVLTFQYALPGDRYPGAFDNAGFHTRFMDELRGLPGVRSVGSVNNVPLDENVSGTAWDLEGTELAEGELSPMIFYTHTSPGYFDAMGIDLLAGREFTNSDHESPWGAAIVSKGMADRYWPDEDPLGKRLRIAGDTTGWETVVGVVDDVRMQGLRNPPPEMVYQPFVSRAGDNGYVIRSPGFVVRAQNVESLIPVVRDRLRGFDGTLPVYRIQTMEQIVENSVVRLSFTMLTLGISAVMALVLGAIGLYGVLSYLVSQRTQEIGVRLALGAQVAQVRRMVVGEGTRLAVVGLGVGLLGAVGLTRLLQGLLYGTEPLDLLTFVGMSAVMLGVGLIASYVPARRASAVDPIESMRLE